MCRVAFLVLGLGLFVVGCKQEEERPHRTEPWPAPRTSAAQQSLGGPVRYRVERGAVEIDLSTRSRQVLGHLSRVEGEVVVDPARLERTRATLRADLLSLSFDSPDDAGPDPGLTRQAFEQLEIGSGLSADRREANRWALVSIDGSETRGSRSSTSGRTVAHGMLTLHRFRVPIELMVRIELSQPETSVGPELRIRTLRDLLVPLEAHALAPLPPTPGTEPEALLELGRDLAPKARISAEITARATHPRSNP